MLACRNPKLAQWLRLMGAASLQVCGGTSNVVVNLFHLLSLLLQCCSIVDNRVIFSSWLIGPWAFARNLLTGRIDLVFEECVEVVQVVSTNFLLLYSFTFGRLALGTVVTFFKVRGLKLFRDRSELFVAWMNITGLVLGCGLSCLHVGQAAIGNWALRLFT